jgi:hypothetical protein
VYRRGTGSALRLNTRVSTDTKLRKTRQNTHPARGRERQEKGEARRRRRPPGRRHGEAETRRAGATAASRQDEGESGDGGNADGAEADGARSEERVSRRVVVYCLSLVFHADSARKSAELAATVKLDLMRKGWHGGGVEGVDGDGGDGKPKCRRQRKRLRRRSGVSSKQRPPGGRRGAANLYPGASSTDMWLVLTGFGRLRRAVCIT